MTWVKVCGLTREPDVAAAVDAGADALGFVLASGSPRQISAERAADLMDGVPALRVLLTVGTTLEDVVAVVGATSPDGLQPYGEHADAVAAWAQANGFLVLHPLRRDAAGGWGIGVVPDGQIPLLDSATDAQLGGTGVPLDWAGIERPERRFVLAGGLNASNVATAVATLRPWGVDASSGLESAPGVKDTARVAAFVEEAKRL
ncbi:MAG: phosphoribosylanthranilate isomerase [Acidimicrobiia bacterium]